LTGLEPASRVRWGMITPAATASKLGSAEVQLQQSRAKLQLRILAPAGSTWRSINTAKPPHVWDSPNPGTQMLAFDAVAPDSGKLTLVVVATPGSCQHPAKTEKLMQSLQQWRRKANH